MNSAEITKAANTVFSITNSGFKKGEIIMIVAKNRVGKTVVNGNVFWQADPNLISYYLPLLHANK
jgi:hypothetical protein